MFVKSKALSLGKRVGEVKSSAWDHVVIGVYQGRFAREKEKTFLAAQPEHQAFLGERRKDGSEKGRELLPLLPPPSKISSPLAP